MYSIQKLSKVLNVEPKQSGADVTIECFSVDSRTIGNYKTTVFVAISGTNHNGHDYVNKLYSLGVKAFIVDEWRQEFASMGSAYFWCVENSVEALQKIAADYRVSMLDKIVAVTGSNGKTIVKEWLYQMYASLPDCGTTLFRSPRSYNSQIGVPLSIMSAPKHTDFSIIEAGISMPGEMHRLAEIIKPNYGIFTNIGDAHSENFDSEEQKLREKLELFRGCKLVVCREGVIPNSLAEQFGFGLTTWGNGQGSDVQIVDRVTFSYGIDVTIECKSQQYKFRIPFVDEASFENVMNVAVFMLQIGVPVTEVIAGVAMLQPIAMRMEIKEGVNGSVLIHDYYNSDPKSFKLALQSLQLQDVNRGRVVILSDFVDVARNDRELYVQIANALEEANVELFIGVGESLMEYGHLFKSMECRFYRSTSEFLKVIDTADFSNKVVLLKGARKYRFEYIAVKLQKQAHKTVLEVDLDAMRRNLNHFRELVPAETKMAVMVKAFTYGCGGTEIASMLQYQGVDYLMVAFADEGIELRATGITAHIAVMNPESEAFDKMVEFGLEPEIFSMDMLQEFNDVVLRHGAQSYPVHIKLNTGMNRSGFDEESLRELLKFFETKRGVKIRSVFSHLAGADEECHDSFTELQIERFDKMSSAITGRFEHKIIRHILNSAGIERFPQYHFDMVRLGIGLHGISAANAKLEPAATFKTHIAAIRNVAKSETVGYGRRGVLDRDSRVAVILVGYADGLDRHLSRGVGEMYVKGHRVPILGNICMDACMLDVTDYPDVQVGDEVEVFGRNVPLTELSDKLGTIPYEIITGISRRVKRLFIKES